MAHYFRLLPHRPMGLVVLVGSGPKFGRIVPAFSGFLIEVMGLLASLINKVAA